MRKTPNIIFSFADDPRNDSANPICEELFDLHKDSNETNNLADKRKDCKKGYPHDWKQQ